MFLIGYLFLAYIYALIVALGMLLFGLNVFFQQPWWVPLLAMPGVIYALLWLGTAFCCVSLLCQDGRVPKNAAGEIVFDKNHWVIRTVFKLNMLRNEECKEEPRDICHFIKGVAQGVFIIPSFAGAACIYLFIHTMVKAGYIFMGFWLKGNFARIDFYPYETYEYGGKEGKWMAPWKIGVPLLLAIILASNAWIFPWLITSHQIIFMWSEEELWRFLFSPLLLIVGAIISLALIYFVIKIWPRIYGAVSQTVGLYAEAIKGRMCLRMVPKKSA